MVRHTKTTCTVKQDHGPYQSFSSVTIFQFMRQMGLHGLNYNLIQCVTQPKCFKGVIFLCRASLTMKKELMCVHGMAHSKFIQCTGVQSVVYCYLQQSNYTPQNNALEQKIIMANQHGL